MLDSVQCTGTILYSVHILCLNCTGNLLYSVHVLYCTVYMYYNVQCTCTIIYSVQVLYCTVYMFYSVQWTWSMLYSVQVIYFKVCRYYIVQSRVTVCKLQRGTIVQSVRCSDTILYTVQILDVQLTGTIFYSELVQYFTCTVRRVFWGTIIGT